MAILRNAFRGLVASLVLAVALTTSALGQTASILPNAKTQFLNANGQPVAGGFVYTCVPNTSCGGPPPSLPVSPKTTWQDAFQMIPNADPVVLDSAGSAYIFGSGNYTETLYDAFGNLIWSGFTASGGSGGGGGSGSVNGPPSSVIGNLSCWANTSGTLLSDCGQLAYVDDYLANVGFTPGTTTALTLSHTPSVSQAVVITFDGIVQAHNTYSFVGAVVTFSAPIPLNVQVVEAQYFVATSIGGVSSLNNLGGALTLAVGSGLTLVTSGGNTLTLSSVSATVVQPPQGYLTLQSAASGGPIQGSSDITAATTVYYSPYTGNQIPVWNGSAFSVLTFNELSLALTSGAQLASTVYDVCVFNNAGTPVAVFGPAWATSSGASAARGTGAGTAQLIRQNGLWVNAVSITANNGATTYVIPASQCTYVGSVAVDASAGQVSAYRTWGQSRKFGIWNAYNRVPICLKVGDSTSSWAYTTATIREANGSTANTLATFSGLAEEEVSTTYTDFSAAVGNGSNGGATFGVGWNSTTAFSGTEGSGVYSSSSTVNLNTTLTGQYTAPPSLGVNNVNALEKASGTNGFTASGTQTFMLLQACWRG